MNLIGAFWLVADLLAITYFLTAQLPGLGSTLWIYSPGGRSSVPDAIPVFTRIVVLVALSLVLLFAGMVVVSLRFSAPQRSWPVLVVILLSWMVSVVMTSVVVSAGPQIGLSSSLTASAALGLISGAAQPAMWIVGLLSLATTAGIPVLASRGKTASV